MSNNMEKWKNLEYELNLFQKSSYKTLTNISIGQLLDCLAVEIEESVQSKDSGEDNFYLKIVRRFRYKSFLKEKSWNPKWKFPVLPEKYEDVSLEDSLLRLKTAMTAFRLHTGPFGKHPIFGNLDKSNWEEIHLKVAKYIFSQIGFKDREKFDKNNKNYKKFHKNKKYFNKKQKFREKG